MKPPAFQFYADDFVAGTSILSTEEIGAYILLLCHQWNSGFIPNDDKLILRIAKITQAFDLGLLKSKFELVDGVLKNPRLEREREKQNKFRRKQAENGEKGGRPKNPSITQAFSKQNPNKSSPSPSPLVEREREASLPEIPPMSRKDFDSLCQMRGIPTECADWFWNTHDARNWTDATGQIIRKVEPVLLNAFKNWRAKASQTQSGSKPSQSVYSITKVIEAKKEQAEGLKARWAVETGLDTTWSSEKAKADYLKLKKEIKELNQKLSGMA